VNLSILEFDQFLYPYILKYKYKSERIWRRIFMSLSTLFKYIQHFILTKHCTNCIMFSAKSSRYCWFIPNTFFVINDKVVGQYLITQRRNNIHLSQSQESGWKRGRRKLDWAHGFCDTVIHGDDLAFIEIKLVEDLPKHIQPCFILSCFLLAWKTMLLICSTKKGKFRSNPCHLMECEQHQLLQNNIILFIFLFFSDSKPIYLKLICVCV
jgi:hypothetical protein